MVEGSPVVLGLDRDAAQWASRLSRLRQGSMAATLMFALLAVGSFVLLEVTSRNHARQVASEERLRVSLQGANLAAWEMDIGSQAIVLDKEWQRLVGAPVAPGPIKFEEFLGYVHPDDRAAVRDSFRALWNGSVDVLECEFRVGQASGRWVWVLCRGKTNARGIQGQKLGAAGFALDISARKEASDILNLQGAALESAANAMMITRPEGTIEWVNPAFEDLTGYSSEEAIGKNPRILKSGQHSDDFYRSLWLTISDGRVWSGELINRRKNGMLYVEDATITPLCDANGKISHYIAVKQDITQRKQTEGELAQSREESKRLALVAENTSNAVIITDTQGFIEWVNAGFTRITGYTLDEVRGRKQEAFLHGDKTDAEAAARMREAIGEGNGFRETMLNYTKEAAPFGCTSSASLSGTPQELSPDSWLSSRTSPAAWRRSRLWQIRARTSRRSMPRCSLSAAITRTTRIGSPVWQGKSFRPILQFTTGSMVKRSSLRANFGPPQTIRHAIAQRDISAWM